MRRIMVVLLVAIFLSAQQTAVAQCSLCTKTAQQLGHKPAKGLNTGIIYLMFAPFMIMGVVGYKWYRNNRT
jgi:hypothetical protein